MSLKNLIHNKDEGCGSKTKDEEKSEGCGCPDKESKDEISMSTAVPAVTKPLTKDKKKKDEAQELTELTERILTISKNRKFRYNV